MPSGPVQAPHSRTLPLAGHVMCVGETMAVVVPSDHARLEQGERFAISHAGGESNVAVSLAHLGTPTAWVGLLGDDPLGRRVLSELTDLGVQTSEARCVVGERTGVMFKDPDPKGSHVYYYRAGSAAATMGPELVPPLVDQHPRHVHVTGVVSGLSRSCRKLVTTLLDEARRAGVPSSFDVNYRPALWTDLETAAATIRLAASLSDTVFVGLDEAHALWGVESSDAVRHFLPEPDTLVVKDGAHSVVAYRGDLVEKIPALPVDVVEPVGAGDAFAAGFLHARTHDLTLGASVRLGHLMAGTVLRSTSDHGSLPATPDELVTAARTGADWGQTTNRSE
ncbi:sugar kinase [Isoptericola sp. BMS4]|uniref:sugar kinase n=1 Tax=Isoptericola sp. BMS4 TaxID=2527875 RepID=UPI00141DA706|nr:sugar kinase [Isoptericola sp. BMS4]